MRETSSMRETPSLLTLEKRLAEYGFFLFERGEKLYLVNQKYRTVLLYEEEVSDGENFKKKGELLIARQEIGFYDKREKEEDYLPYYLYVHGVPFDFAVKMRRTPQFHYDPVRTGVILNRMLSYLLVDKVNGEEVVKDFWRRILNSRQSVGELKSEGILNNDYVMHDYLKFLTFEFVHEKIQKGENFLISIFDDLELPLAVITDDEAIESSSSYSDESKAEADVELETAEIEIDASDPRPNTQEKVINLNPTTLELVTRVIPRVIEAEDLTFLLSQEKNDEDKALKLVTALSALNSSRLRNRGEVYSAAAGYLLNFLNNLPPECKIFYVDLFKATLSSPTVLFPKNPLLSPLKLPIKRTSPSHSLKRTYGSAEHPHNSRTKQRRII
jgi:hypothetical protein